LITIKNVSKKYKTLKAAENIDLKIKKSVFFGLLGPNGAGKTTLIRMLVGLSKPDRGKIIINGVEINKKNYEVKKYIGIVPQYNNLDNELTVKENLIFCAKLFKIPKKKYKIKIDELLNFFELKSFSNYIARNLSGGMKRKLVIAKALINNPKILILDEPTIGLDVNLRKKIWDILKAMKNEGKTIIMTTHYIEEAETLCDVVSFMNKGKIFSTGKPIEFINQKGKITLEYFNENNITDYKYFSTLLEAKLSAKKLTQQFTIRNTTLEDVFYYYTRSKFKI
jgi:ABC-2 type transport system ATP-binding protein